MQQIAVQSGRNEPCPCGSGKKFKKCCAEKQQAAPENPQVFLSALQLCNQGHLREAASICERLISQNPRHVNALHLLANIMATSGNLEASFGLYEATIEAAPDFIDAYLNYATSLTAAGKLDNALEILSRAIALKPSLPGPYCKTGDIYKSVGGFGKAIEFYKMALAKDPKHRESLRNLCSIIHNRAGLEETRHYLKTYLELYPSDAARINYETAIPSIMKSHDDIREHRERVSRNIDSLIAAGVRVADPVRELNLYNFFFSYHGENNKELFAKFAALYSSACPALLFKAPHVEEPRKEGKLKVAFLSKFFYKHSVSKCFNGVIDGLVKDPRLEVKLLCSGEAHFKNMATANLGAAMISVPDDIFEAQKVIAALNLDILIFTEIGMHAPSYFLAFSRLARVQCILGGHPDTSGIPAMDYYISSQIIEPESVASQHTEKPLLLERSPTIIERSPVPANPKTLKELGLPEGKRIYLCPMMLHKLHPDFDKAMGEILKKDPGGVVVLFADTPALYGDNAPWARAVSERLMSSLPLDVAERIMFVPWADSGVFMDYLIRADVILDSFYFGGGTTAYAAFSAGVPVITWPAEMGRARCVYECAMRMEIPELIAKNQDDYVEKAVRIANDKTTRETLKTRILENNNKFFDNNGVVTELADELLKLFPNLP